MAGISRAKNQLQEMISAIISEEMVPINIYSPMLRFWCESETLRAIQGEESSMGSIRVRNRTIDADILVYGSDPERIDLVVQGALQGTVMSITEFVTIKLSGRKVGELTCEGFREVLSFEFQRHNNPNRVLILLERFTIDMLSKFRRSGFVNGNRIKGIRISTICWTTLQSRDDSVLREFGIRVFVPSSKDEEDMMADDVEEMIVHKPVATAAVGELPFRDDWIWKTDNRIQGRAMYREQGYESSSLRPIRNQERMSATTCATLGHPRTAANITSFPAGQNDVTYTDVMALKKDSVPARPITTEPSHAKQPSSSELAVNWTKSKPESVSVEICDDNEGGDGGGKDIMPVDCGKEAMPANNQGPCGKFCQCIWTGLACLLD